MREYNERIGIVVVTVVCWEENLSGGKAVTLVRYAS
jgi:hypothetical protein